LTLLGMNITSGMTTLIFINQFWILLKN